MVPDDIVGVELVAARAIEPEAGGSTMRIAGEGVVNEAGVTAPLDAGEAGAAEVDAVAAAAGCAAVAGAACANVGWPPPCCANPGAPAIGAAATRGIAFPPGGPYTGRVCAVTAGGPAGLELIGAALEGAGNAAGAVPATLGCGETLGVKLDDIPPAGTGEKFGTPGRIVAPVGGGTLVVGGSSGAPAGEP